MSRSMIDEELAFFQLKLLINTRQKMCAFSVQIHVSVYNHYIRNSLPQGGCAKGLWVMVTLVAW
jgi:hypothetical protein